MTEPTTIELTTEQLEGIAYFATAEALSQGYNLEDEGERASFLRHVEGSARQYFMKRGVWPFFQLRASLGDGLVVASIFAVHEGHETELMVFDVLLP